jgi:hypothetical protein
VAGNSIVLVLDSTLVAIKQTPHQMEAVTEQKKKKINDDFIYPKSLATVTK